MTKRTARSCFLLVLLALTASRTVEAKKKNHNAPHPHKGLMKPYSPGPFDIKLTSAEEAKLRKGEAVLKQTLPEGPSESGSAISVQDVEAPVDAVWHQILDLDHYKEKVPGKKVKVMKNYFVKPQKDKTVRIKTKQVLSVMPGYAVSLLWRRSK